MILTIILSIVGLIGLSLEYKRNLLSDNSIIKKIQRYILIISVLGIIGNSIKQTIDNKESKKNTEIFKKTIESLIQI